MTRLINYLYIVYRIHAGRVEKVPWSGLRVILLCSDTVWGQLPFLWTVLCMCTTGGQPELGWGVSKAGGQFHGCKCLLATEHQTRSAGQADGGACVSDAVRDPEGGSETGFGPEDGLAELVAVLGAGQTGFMD